MMQATASRAAAPGVALRRSAVAGLRAAPRCAVARRAPVAVRASVVAEPASLEVKSTDGAVAGSETLALKVADDSARGLVHRYMVYVRQNARQGNASTKTRAEVRGGGKKPYRQKGTGNARRGSTRSPLIVGGGVSFGPKPKDWSISMNKKERRLAMGTAIQSAVEDIIVVEDLAGKFGDKKTKTVVNMLEKVGASKDEYTLLIVGAKDEDLELASRNVEKLKVTPSSMLNVYDILRADNVVIDKPALEAIKALLA